MYLYIYIYNPLYMTTCTARYTMKFVALRKWLQFAAETCRSIKSDSAISWK